MLDPLWAVLFVLLAWWLSTGVILLLDGLPQATFRLSLGGVGVLAKLKGLRGGALDLFGRTEERRMERRLIEEYKACIDELLKSLNAGNVAAAAEIARIPEEIRGFGHVKARHLAAARGKWSTLMAQWRTGSAGAQRAA